MQFSAPNLPNVSQKTWKFCPSQPLFLCLLPTKAKSNSHPSESVKLLLMSSSSVLVPRQLSLQLNSSPLQLHLFMLKSLLKLPLSCAFLHTDLFLQLRNRRVYFRLAGTGVIYCHVHPGQTVTGSLALQASRSWLSFVAPSTQFWAQLHCLLF